MKFKISSKYMYLQRPELAEDGSVFERHDGIAFRPYGDDKPECELLLGGQESTESVKIEINSLCKFEKYFKDAVLREKASAALLEYIRHDYLQKVLKSESVIFYVTSPFDICVDDDFNITNEAFKSLDEVGIEIKSANDNLNSNNKVVKFHTKNGVSAFEITGIQKFNYTQRAVFEAFYRSHTIFAGELLPVYNSLNHRKIAETQKLFPDKSHGEIKRDLKFGYELGIARDSQYLYEQLYFSIEDFVELR